MQKKTFLDCHQVIYSSSSISLQSLKLLNIILLEISRLQIICRDDSKKKSVFFFLLLFPPGDLLIILYQVTKFETHTYSTFADITIINSQSPNLQREINRKNKLLSLIFTRQSTYHPLSADEV